MSKYLMLTVIIVFWLFFPLPIMFMESGNFESVEDKTPNNIEKATAINFLGISFDLFQVYVQIFFLGIPNAPLIINTFVFSLKLISGLIIYSLLRLG